MNISTAARSRKAGHPMKSPLAAAHHNLATAASPCDTAARQQLHDPAPRAVTLKEFAGYLRTVTNRDGRPYQSETVSTYVYAGRALDAWMSTADIEGNFSVVDTAMLNRFFRDYFRQHGQGGTNAQQRNLRHLFNFLHREEGLPHPYAEDLHRYTEVKRRPATLSGDFVHDLLEVTGGGRPPQECPGRSGRTACPAGTCQRSCSGHILARPQGAQA
ncbi:MAG: hypothetical protein ACRDNF_07855, partial [Streptosporangiaceae bacterium]